MIEFTFINTTTPSKADKNTVEQITNKIIFDLIDFTIFFAFKFQKLNYTFFFMNFMNFMKILNFSKKFG